MTSRRGLKNGLKREERYDEMPLMKSQAPLTKQEKRTLGLFSQKLQDHFGSRLTQMTLYGSAARGERHDESDVDILVLIQGLTWEEKRHVWDVATLINIDHDTMLSPLVLKPEEFQELRDRERRIALDIDQEGIQL